MDMHLLGSVVAFESAEDPRQLVTGSCDHCNDFRLGSEDGWTDISVSDRESEVTELLGISIAIA